MHWLLKYQYYGIIQTIILVHAIIIDTFMLQFSQIVPAFVLPFGIPNKFILSFLDSYCHGISSIGVWMSYILISENVGLLSFRRVSKENILHNIIGPYICGTFIDIDHFIAAKSFYYINATNLQSRPFGHCMLFGCLLVILVYALSKNRKLAMMITLGYISHIIRDSYKRGLWILPNIYTGKFYYALYLLIISLLALFIWWIELIVRYRYYFKIKETQDNFDIGMNL